MWQKEGLCDVAVTQDPGVILCPNFPSSKISLNFIPMAFIADGQTELILNATKAALTNLLTDICPRLVLEWTKTQFNTTR